MAKEPTRFSLPRAALSSWFNLFTPFSVDEKVRDEMIVLKFDEEGNAILFYRHVSVGITTTIQKPKEADQNVTEKYVRTFRMWALKEFVDMASDEILSFFETKEGSTIFLETQINGSVHVKVECSKEDLSFSMPMNDGLFLPMNVDLGKAFEHVLHAATKGGSGGFELHAPMECIDVIAEKTRTAVLATDGKAMSIVIFNVGIDELDSDANAEKRIESQVPSKMAAALASTGQSFVMFAGASSNQYLSLFTAVEEKPKMKRGYPNVIGFLNRNEPFYATVDRSEFFDAIVTAEAIARYLPGKKAVMTLDPIQKVGTIEAKANGVGEIRSTFQIEDIGLTGAEGVHVLPEDATKWPEEPFVAQLNAEYLMDAVAGCDGESGVIRISFNSKKKPVVFQAEGKAPVGDIFMNIVMPIVNVGEKKE